MVDKPFGEENFSSAQSKPPLAKDEATSSCPVVCYSGGETDFHLLTSSFQAVAESNEVPHRASFSPG